jgi:hypothetical protein
MVLSVLRLPTPQLMIAFCVPAMPMRAKNLKPFVSDELERSSAPLIYLTRNPTAGAGGLGYGYRGTLNAGGEIAL